MNFVDVSKLWNEEMGLGVGGSESLQGFHILAGLLCLLD